MLQNVNVENFWLLRATESTRVPEGLQILKIIKFAAGSNKFQNARSVLLHIQSIM